MCRQRATIAIEQREGRAAFIVRWRDGSLHREEVAFHWAGAQALKEAIGRPPEERAALRLRFR